MLWVVVSLVVALVLDSLSLGAALQPFNPPWTLMVLIYWCWIMPRQVGPFTGFCAGLLLDTLSAGVLGLHALGASLVGYLANAMRRVFNRSPLWQQAFMAWGLILVYKAVVGWIQSLFAAAGLGLTYWASSLVVLAAYPVVYTLLKELTPIRRTT